MARNDAFDFGEVLQTFGASEHEQLWSIVKDKAHSVVASAFEQAQSDDEDDDIEEKNNAVCGASSEHRSGLHLILSCEYCLFADRGRCRLHGGRVRVGAGGTLHRFAALVRPVSRHGEAAAW